MATGSGASSRGAQRGAGRAYGDPDAKESLRTIRIPGGAACGERIERGVSILAHTVLAGTSVGIKEVREPIASRTVQIYPPGRLLARILRGGRMRPPSTRGRTNVRLRVLAEDRETEAGENGPPHLMAVDSDPANRAGALLRRGTHFCARRQRRALRARCGKCGGQPDSRDHVAQGYGLVVETDKGANPTALQASLAVTTRTSPAGISAPSVRGLQYRGDTGGPLFLHGLVERMCTQGRGEARRRRELRGRKIPE